MLQSVTATIFCIVPSQTQSCGICDIYIYIYIISIRRIALFSLHVRLKLQINHVILNTRIPNLANTLCFFLFVLMKANCQITKMSLSLEEYFFIVFIHFTYASCS